jgi:hypothetical protein
MDAGTSRPFVIALLIVQVGLTAALWVIDAISINSTAAFALLLAADVLVFAGICHIYFFTEVEGPDATVDAGTTSAEPEATSPATPTPEARRGA